MADLQNEAHPDAGIVFRMEVRDPPRSPLFLSVPDAARLLGVSPERLARALKASQIPSIVIGSRRLIARAAIEKLAQLEKDSA